MTSDMKSDPVTAILAPRGGMLTLVTLYSGLVYRVFDIAAGRDMDAEGDHITSNISPGRENEAIDFFVTQDVKKLEDGANGQLLFERE